MHGLAGEATSGMRPPTLAGHHHMHLTPGQRRGAMDTIGSASGIGVTASGAVLSPAHGVHSSLFSPGLLHSPGQLAPSLTGGSAVAGGGRYHGTSARRLSGALRGGIVSGSVPAASPSQMAPPWPTSAARHDIGHQAPSSASRHPPRSGGSHARPGPLSVMVSGGKQQSRRLTFLGNADSPIPFASTRTLFSAAKPGMAGSASGGGGAGGAAHGDGPPPRAGQRVRREDGDLFASLIEAVEQANLAEKANLAEQAIQQAAQQQPEEASGRRGGSEGPGAGRPDRQ